MLNEDSFYDEYKLGFIEVKIMEKNTFRIVVSIVIGYIVLWYVGAMFSFFPFLGDDAVSAIGFTGLLICLVIVACACWIIEEIRKK